jgi:hypothetical protein
MAARARGRGSSHGIDGAILETSLGGTGTVLEADTREAGRRRPDVGIVASGAGAVQSRAAGTQEGFPGCRTPSEAAGGSRINSELCADAEQRLWRTVTRKKYQLRRNHARLQNQVESLLEEAHIKLSSLVTDLLGVSAWRMLKALAEGETDPAALAALADERLRATPEQLCDALGACTELNAVYRRLLKMALEGMSVGV